VNKFKTYEINYSDHKPIYSEIIIWSKNYNNLAHN
jgi:hypothetical protein